MKLTTLVNGVERQLEIKKPAQPGEPYAFSLDGRPATADIHEIVPGVYSILLGHRSFEIKIDSGEGSYTAAVNGRRFDIAIRDPRKLARAGTGVADEGPQKLTAPMPGKVVRVLVEEGQQVDSGQGLVVVEAMKMQNEMKSPKAGVVKSIPVKQGGSVSAGQVLAIIE